MAQNTSGIYSILSKSIAYDLFAKLMGAKKGRQFFATHFIKANSNMKILDIGCGTSQIVDYLPNDCHYYGYDISPEYINTAKKNMAKEGIFIAKNLKNQNSTNCLNLISS